MTPDAAHINRRSAAGKRRDPIAGYALPNAFARQCLEEAGGDPSRAIALVRKYVIGKSSQRATIAAIGSALLRASTSIKKGAS
jgi:hypothetical protein